MIYLIDKSNNIINIDENINPDDILINIFANKYKLQDNNNKNIISNLNYSLIPMFNISFLGIVLVNKYNVFEKMKLYNYRIIDKNIYNFLVENNKNKFKNFCKYEKWNVFMENYAKRTIEALTNFNLKEFNFNLNNIILSLLNDAEKSVYLEQTSYIKADYSHNIKFYVNPSPYYNINQLISDNNINLDKNYKKIYKRDFSYIDLLNHKNYILKNHAEGIINYYGLIGSYKINNYLREIFDFKNKYNNIILNKFILNFWNLIRKSPAFINDFYIYRIINNDTFLENLNINDIYIDNAFLSCTRDPNYIVNNYNFGNILLKIKIPKNTIGCGLCYEFFSFFTKEQEIILPPKIKLKLIAKNNNVIFNHYDKNIQMKFDKKYEFIIDVDDFSDISINNKVDISLNTIKYFDNTKFSYSSDIENMFSQFKKLYLNENNQINYKVNESIFDLNFDLLDISPNYLNKFIFIRNNNNNKQLFIYKLDKNNIIFNITIIYHENNYFIHINPYNYYMNKSIDKNVNINDFFILLKNLSKIFKMKQFFLITDYITCKNNFSSFNYEIYNYFKFKKSYYCEFDNIFYIDEKYNIFEKENIKNNDIINKIISKKNYKKVNNYYILTYHIFNEITFEDIYSFFKKNIIIFNKNIYIEIYSIYTYFKLNIINNNLEYTDNVANFYLFLVDYSCYQIFQLTKLMQYYVEFFLNFEIDLFNIILFIDL